MQRSTELNLPSVHASKSLAAPAMQGLHAHPPFYPLPASIVAAPVCCRQQTRKQASKQASKEAGKKETSKPAGR